MGLAEFGLIVQTARQRLGTSPDAISLIVDSENDRLNRKINSFFNNESIDDHVLHNVRENRSKFINIASQYYGMTDCRPLSTLPTIGSSTPYDAIKQLRKPCPVELETSSDISPATQKVGRTWPVEAILQVNTSIRIDKKLGITQSYIDQCIHHAAVLNKSHCLYVVGTVRSIVHVVLFLNTWTELHSYISVLEETFKPRVEWMYEDGKVEQHIPASPREFGFAIERNSLIQRIHLLRAFIKTEKGSNAFSARPIRLKLQLSVAMNWNYAMGNVDIAHRLMLKASLQHTIGLNSQQKLCFKFVTVLIVNVYRDWSLYLNGDDIVQRFNNYKAGNCSMFEGRT